MRPYRVTWTIEVGAETPEDAAKQCRDIQLDKDSIATVFEVTDLKTAVCETVDLLEK